MMLFVSVVKHSGLFEYIALRAAKLAKGRPWPLMLLLTLLTALLSAFLDNVTTVLLIGPMTLAITGRLKLNPVPFFPLPNHGRQHRRHRHPYRRSPQYYDRQRRRAELFGLCRQHRRGGGLRSGRRAGVLLFPLWPEAPGRPGGYPGSAGPGRTGRPSRISLCSARAWG